MHHTAKGVQTMHTDDYQYRMNQLYRERVMRAANRRHLIRTATERRPKSRREYSAALMALWHSLFR
jgi:hypothetical protein